MSKLPRRIQRRKFSLLVKIAVFIAFAAYAAFPAVACDCDEPVIIDGLEAYGGFIFYNLEGMVI
jgi:hypothetical protein